MPLRFSTSSGNSITLGAELGKGGEGAVYEVVGSSDLVAKLYTDGRAEDRRAKLEAMVSAGLHRQAPHISFPIDMLLDGSHSFVGFTMRRVHGARPIHQLWNSRDRQEKFPDSTVSFMVRVAANAARTVAELHHTGCVIGDINESGFLVTDQATVIMIDSDSIQYTVGARVFPCVVGTPEYLPPEHQGVNQRNLTTRNANHDNFGLAVMIFRLLMNGAHPFRGVWKGRGDPPSPPKWIEEFRYAYGTDIGRQKIAPQPTAPPVDWLPNDLRNAFERAFGRSSAQQRPTAQEWIDMLERFENDLVRCHKSRFHHHRPGIRSCPWCETEQKRGRELFGDVKTSYQQASPGGPTGAGPNTGTGNAGTARPMSPPPQQQAPGNGLRNAILAIIGIAIVSLFVFGRDQGFSSRVEGSGIQAPRSAATQSLAIPPAVLGVWEGTVRGGNSAVQASLTLSERSGEIVFASWGCRGSLRPTAIIGAPAPITIQFSYQLVTGPRTCSPEGRVILTRNDDGSYHYAFERSNASGLLSSGILRREQERVAELQRWNFRTWSIGQSVRMNTSSLRVNTRLCCQETSGLWIRLASITRDSAESLRLDFEVYAPPGNPEASRFLNRRPPDNEFLLFVYRDAPHPVGGFYARAIHLLDDRERRYVALNGIEGRRSNQWNSSAYAALFPFEETSTFFVRFPLPPGASNSLTFVSPSLSGHQVEWRWTLYDVR